MNYPPPHSSWSKHGYCSFSSLHVSLIIAILAPFSNTTTSTLAASTISSNNSLTGSQTLTSDGGKFVLGFFSPAANNSTRKNYYIGIWYRDVSDRTVVWVANRVSPIPDPSTSQLKISADGNLVLVDDSNATFWSTNTTTSRSATVRAELLDSGNLVLRDASNMLWQSFDLPTDTWLPGMKIGLNRVTGENQLLISWKNSEDPSPGIYSLELDPSETSQYIIRWNRSRKYWSSGPWNEEKKIFSGVPEMTLNYIYNFSYVTNDKESYFTYTVKNNSIVSRFVMDLSGQIKQLTWLDPWNLFWSQPKSHCDVYSLCGPFGSCSKNDLPYCSCFKGFSEASPNSWALEDRSGGCVRNAPLQCGDKDWFYAMNHVKVPDNAQSLLSPARSAQECQSACLGNCTCIAFSYGTRGCSVWYGDLLNLQQLPYEDDDASNSGTLQLRLAASELPPMSHKKKGGVAVVASVASVAAGVVAIVMWLVVRRQRQRWAFGKLKVEAGTVVPFKYRDLRRATNDFSEKLGGGGFGSVFKGALSGSTEIAVKKLEGIYQGEKQFRTEVSTIGKIQHVNLVRLHGFCSEGANRLLVYEHMSNGSLAAVLLQSSLLPVMDWGMRYKILLGIARGLAYLHEECRECIIHCDIKPENILLDASYAPKIADFGLAKIVGRDFSRVLTTMRGTRGYLAPEWISGLPITAKADVYSYGMMLFEIISGRRNTEVQVGGEEENNNNNNSVFFPSLAASKLLEDNTLSLLDPRLEGVANLEELDRVCKTACWCVQDDEKSRPSMGLVVQILEGAVGLNMPPIPRSLQNLLSDNQEHIPFFSDLPTAGQSQIHSTTSASE